MAKKLTEKVRRKLGSLVKKSGAYTEETKEELEALIDYFDEHASSQDLIEIQKFYTSFGSVPEGVDGKKKF